jgi:hypothetical protein
MNNRIGKLLCYTLICCITACATTSSYEVGETDSTETYSILSRHIVIDQDIRVHLRDGSIVDMRAVEVTAETLNGLVDGNVEIQKIYLEDILSVETNFSGEPDMDNGWGLLVAILMASIIMWAVASSGSGYDFSGLSFGGGG